MFKRVTKPTEIADLYEAGLLWEHAVGTKDKVPANGWDGWLPIWRGEGGREAFMPPRYHFYLLLEE